MDGSSSPKTLRRPGSAAFALLGLSAALLGSCGVLDDDEPVSEHARANGETCRRNGDCASGRCGVQLATSETRCYGNREVGQSCTSTFDCAGGICFDVCEDPDARSTVAPGNPPPAPPVAPASAPATDPNYVPSTAFPCQAAGLSPACDAFAWNLCSYYKAQCPGHEGDRIVECMAWTCSGLKAGYDCQAPLDLLTSGKKVPVCP